MGMDKRPNAFCEQVKCPNLLTNGKMMDLSKLTPFADDKLNVAKMISFVCVWLENIVGKGENVSYQHFLLFPQYFQKVSISVW